MKFSIPKIKLPAWLTFSLKLAISAAIIALILRKIDERILLEVMRDANPLWILWALVWFALSKLISAFRFNTLMRSEGIYMTAAKNIRLYWLCMYYNLLLPGGISGDGYKIKLLMDTFGKPFKRIFTLTLQDRISGLFALGQLSLVLLGFVAPFSAWWYLFLPAFVLSFLVSWMVFRYLTGKLARVWMITTLQSFGVQGAQSIATIGLVIALAQGAYWPDYILLFLVSSVVAMLPVTIGGAGARELTFLYGAKYLHIHAEKAVAIGFLFYLISTFVSFMGIVFSFRKSHVLALNGQPDPGAAITEKNNS